MNTPVIIINEDDTQKKGAIYIGKLESGMIQLAVEDTETEHLDEASVIMYPEKALRLGMKLIAIAYKEDRDS